MIGQPPTVRLRRLGAELRKLREERGLTLEAAGRLIDRSPASLSKIEQGNVTVRIESVEYMLRKYSVADEQLREALIALARDSRKKGWWQQYGSVLSPSDKDYLSLETDVSAIRNFETVLVPGLLQTQQYARAVMESALHPRPPREIDRLVTMRKNRQEMLTRPVPPSYHAIIDEAVLHRNVGGPDVMRGQLAHLQESAEFERVEVQVIPFADGYHPGLRGPFEIMTLPMPVNFSVVIIENTSGRLFIEQDDAVAPHQEVFDHLSSTALSPEESRSLIERLMSSA